MPITLGIQIASLTAQRQLAKAGEELSTTYERLSSGLRISRVSDDPAGLAVALSLSADARICRQGLRNLNDGISLLNIADAALAELDNILARQRELAALASNGTLSLAQRQALNKEAEALSGEFNRIVESAAWNGIRVFDAATGRISIQAGAGVDNVISFNPAEAFVRTVGDGTFGATTSFYTAGSFGIRAADLNGDGHADFVVGALENNAVVLGNGDGTFRAAVLYPTVALDFGHQLFLKDVNGDGTLDVLATHGASDTFSVMLGAGDGTFGAALSFATNGAPQGITVADFNGDGKQDVAVRTQTGETVDLFMGNNDGTFLAPTTLSAPGIGVEIEAFDLNNDSFVDLVVTGGNMDMKVYLNGGSGNFTLAQNIVKDNWNYAVEVADFNRDGIYDLAYTDGSAALGPLCVALGNGDGTFIAADRYDIDNNRPALLATDLNGDGIVDLAVTPHLGAPGINLNVFVGRGDGSFIPSMSGYYADPDTPYAADGADFNEDGAVDLVIGSQAGNRTYVALANTRQTGATPYLDLASQAGAQAAMGTIEQSMERILAARGVVGAALSRLQVAANHAAALSAEYESALSRITEPDIADEVAKMVREQIVQRTATAILAQANQQLLIALKLLEESGDTAA